MDKNNDMMGGPSANNSSDFVRKLYKMLEDPSYESIVRWGEGGQSFVVLENEKFTKLILPKHFKHSNFASFVRQLNKYDFHKVRQNNEDNTPSPYGPNAWEFKHPEFQADKKDSLDNIRRKAPAPRKPAQGLEDSSYPAQQMDLVNSQLVATQQQLQQLSERYQDLAQGHVVLLQQVVQLQKFVKAHDGVMHKVMRFLHNVDNEQRRNSRLGGPYASGHGPGMVGSLSNEADHPASPLQQASELLDKFSAETLPNMELAKMADDYHLRNDYSTPPSEQAATNNIGPVSTAAPSTQIGYPIGNDLDNMVYPVGHTNGIDPIHSEHINNIPYALPANGILHVEQPMQEMLPEASDNGRKKSSGDSPWGLTKPRILLVEDDKVCARIGSKFLQAFECGVETARDGLEAVTKINTASNSFDLILMDIIMPNLDGVSATVCIREIRPHIPIIAMTSNIRADDIDMYFRYGMNDVLPKPFTKEGMLRALEKNLPQFRKNPQFPNPTQPPNPGSFVTPSQTQASLGLNMGQLSAAQPLKDDTSPGKSPGTASSWHSPSQLPSTSPVNPQGNYGTYSMAPTHQQHPFAQSGYQPQNPAMGAPASAPRTGPHRRVMSDMTGAPGPDDHPDQKRQRMYPAPQGSFPQ